MTAYYNFTIQGPDDAHAEEITGGTECDFFDALDRYTMDDVLTMREAVTGRVIRCEHGRKEC